jgi:1-acyl-sn-glycerol-3-phosphate acyltransferase
VQYSTIRKIIYRFFQFLLYSFFRVYYRFNIKGVSNLPRKGGYILAVNHQSFFDPPVVGCPVPGFVCFYARSTLWESRFFSFVDWVLKDIIPVKRGESDRTALKEAISRLNNGWVLLMFPEGTRTRDGNLGQVKTGPAFISARAGVPIVPTILKGAFEIWPKGKKIPRLLGWPFNRLKVSYGEPIWIDDYKQYSGKERLNRITKMLDFRLHELFNDEKQ